jgi:ankyrin repeat protein
MNKYAPEIFFEGQELEAARTIKDGRNNELSSLITGLDLNKPGKKQMTLLWFAIQEKNFDAIRLIVQHGAKPDEQGVDGLGTALSFALQHKDVRYLTAMLDGGLPLNMQKEYGASMLQRAAGAEGATLDHVKLLVERGADLNMQDSIGGTALLSAINTNQPDRAFYLVEQGADLNKLTTRGVSAMWAVKLSIDGQQPGEMRTNFEKLRDLMISKGAKYPPDSSAEVRKWMRAQGMKVSGKD